MGEHEVDRSAHGLDPRRLLVGHLDPVRVLELLHERVEVERVGVEVVAEVRALVDARGIELQLVGQMRTDQLQALFPRQWSGTVAALSDGLRRAPAAASRSCVRPTTSSRTPRAATSIARAKPRSENEP